MGRSCGEPQRTCVGCGRSAAKSDLLRLVASGAHAVPDPAAHRQGRGAYICRVSPAQPDPACLERAIRRGGLARALRRPVRIAPDLAPGLGDSSGADGASPANHLESIG